MTVLGLPNKRSEPTWLLAAQNEDSGGEEKCLPAEGRWRTRRAAHPRPVLRFNRLGMAMMNETVKKYFGEYLDIGLDTLPGNQVEVLESQRRTEPEKGWGYAVPIWAFVFDNKAVISTSPEYYQKLSSIPRKGVGVDTLLDDDFCQELAGRVSPELRVRRHYVYSCSSPRLKIHPLSECRQMTGTDTAEFIRFSQEIYPEIDVECETNDIIRNINDGIAYGVFLNGKMVTRSYAPHIAHMQDRVEEIGVDTHHDLRNKGYGRSALSETTGAVLNINRVPICRVSRNNIASQRIVESVGYFKIADSIEVIEGRP